MSNQSGSFPKIIWIFWFQGFENAPGLVKKCLSSWQLNNPGWQINVLDEKEYKKHIDIDPITALNRDTMNVQSLSEILRINLINKYGGVWVDATCFCCQPLDEWLPNFMTSGFFAFERHGDDRLISSWFLASTKESYLTTALCEAINWYWGKNRFPYQKRKYGRKAIKWIGKILNQNPRRASLWAHPLTLKILKLQPYYCFQYVFYRLLATDRRSREIWDKTPKVRVDSARRMQLAGLLNPVTAEIKSIIDSRKDAIYKLDWRKDKDLVPGCNLDYLLNSLELQFPQKTS